MPETCWLLMLTLLVLARLCLLAADDSMGEILILSLLLVLFLG